MTADVPDEPTGSADERDGAPFPDSKPEPMGFGPVDSDNLKAY